MKPSAHAPKPAAPQAWPADKVERRNVADLVPYARNARTHSAEQVVQLASSIERWGWTTPVLLDESGGIIAGHGRVLAIELSPAYVDVAVLRWQAFTGKDARDEKTGRTFAEVAAGRKTEAVAQAAE